MIPIILIGAGRSGTKFLRSLLDSSESINVIPYDVGYVWRYGNESYESDELKPIHLNYKIKKYIRKTLPKLVDGKAPSPLYFVEKSVPNSLRVKFIHEVYPEAKFIFLVRDGRAVTESSMRLWNASSDKTYLLKKLKYFPWTNYRYAFWYITNMLKGIINGRGQNLWGPRYENINSDVKELPLEVICARQWKKCVESSARDFKTIPSNQVLQVRYEDFMRDCNELSRICDFLEISDAERVIDKFNRTVESSNLEKWRNSLKGESLAQVEEELGATLKKFGYL